MVAKSKVVQASEQVKVLDEETQALLSSVKRNNTKAISWFIACWTILFLLAVGGIWKQNLIAAQNKQHIDCIIKDLATPQKPGTQHKYIENLSTDCKIKFTQ